MRVQLKTYIVSSLSYLSSNFLFLTQHECSGYKHCFLQEISPGWGTANIYTPLNTQNRLFILPFVQGHTPTLWYESDVSHEFTFPRTLFWSYPWFCSLHDLVWGPNYWMQVRLYTAQNVFQNLKLAKQEFIEASAYVDKGTKIFLPKILSFFAKDTSLSMHKLLEVVTGCVSEAQHKEMERCMKGRPHKCIHWLPQSSTFRYVIHGELANARIDVWWLTPD